SFCLAVLYSFGGPGGWAAAGRPDSASANIGHIASVDVMVEAPTPNGVTVAVGRQYIPIREEMRDLGVANTGRVAAFWGRSPLPKPYMIRMGRVLGSGIRKLANPRRYAFAAAIAAAGLLIRFALRPFLHDQLPFATQLVSVLLAARYWGVGPGILTMLL